MFYFTFLNNSISKNSFVFQITITPVEQPKPTVDIQTQKEEEQVVTTTTQVEEQPVPQVTTDVSTTQPKPEEQVS